MPRAATAPRSAKVRAPARTATASGRASAGTAATFGGTDFADAEADEKPLPTKEDEAEGKVTDEETTKQSTREPIVKPPLCKEWLDIPDWKGREDSPLLVPVEVTDKIFCVRPELNVYCPYCQLDTVLERPRLTIAWRLSRSSWYMYFLQGPHD